VIVDIHFKHMDASDSLRDYATDKSEKLKKYFDGKVHVTWNFMKEHGEFVSHCHAVGSHIDLFGEGQADEAYAAVDMAIARLEKQLKKHKEIVTDHKTDPKAEPPTPSGEE
jgi:putative sigma-54 modulation protein